MPAPRTDLRKRLEKAIIEARVIAEQGARKALEALAVGRHEPHGSMSADEKALRNRLRAHGRQLGDARDRQNATQSIRRLEREVAYEHWHRMLFARFLAENGLLIEPSSQVAISIEECEELAREQGLDPWALAASFAQGMLPQIFRPDDPVLSVGLPPETRQALQKLLADLEPEVFTADDSLGWTYQFWQSAEKEAVNARVKSGEKITGESLPAVTQLFTEPYMVQFLLHNTIGAWHAGKVLAARPELAATAASEQELRDAVALEGYGFEYLRFVRLLQDGDADGDPSRPWSPAAGTYSGWPTRASELKVLDPCCGSGHFLVAAFDLLVRLRQAEEGLAINDAIRAVLKDNLFGLELDARCTQIAAFHLALAAWRMAGAHIELPALHIACSGIGPNASKEEWLQLAQQAAASGGMPAKRDLFRNEESLLSDALRNGLEELYETFTLAPEIGSLLDPAGQTADLLTAGLENLMPLLAAVLEVESASDEVHERAVAARGMAKTWRILTAAHGGYTLVLTNVPYLQAGAQSKQLSSYLKRRRHAGRTNVATAMLLRIRKMLGPHSVLGVVSPQDWLYKDKYGDFRQLALESLAWNFLARLGPGAFETISGEVVDVSLLVASRSTPSPHHAVPAIDAQTAKGPSEKSKLLISETPTRFAQLQQKQNPRCVVITSARAAGRRLSTIASFHNGICCGDQFRFTRCTWEVDPSDSRWAKIQGTVKSSRPYGGLERVFLWEGGDGAYREYVEARLGPERVNTWIRGQEAWGRRGILVSAMGPLPVAHYLGELFDDNTVAIVPNFPEHIDFLWSFMSAPEYAAQVREIDRSLKVRGPLVRVAFDEVALRSTVPAKEDGPHSIDCTQWVFHGHPSDSEAGTALQVGVARLVGYRWPAELDEGLHLAPESREIVRRCSELAAHADNDGIVCVSSVHGEGTAADRLRSLLAQCFGPDWAATKEHDLLTAAGERFDKGKIQPSLEHWVRDRFFEEHCVLFHSRPFVWHIWDGLPDGFHALVNYHRLAGADGQGRKTLEKLTSTYLGEWIDRQRQRSAAGEEGADGRLAAATALQIELRKIQEGEPPYDIFVRWKALHDQPLGWEPDINDGVRLNIRPFLMAKDVRAKNAGILRVKPDNTWCNGKKLGVKDRGQEPEQLRPRHLFPWFWGCDPEQHREHRTDFGAGTPGSAPAGKEFDGARWNGLHYTRAAKQAARHSAAERGAREAGS